MTSKVLGEMFEVDFADIFKWGTREIADGE